MKRTIERDRLSSIDSANYHSTHSMHLISNKGPFKIDTKYNNNDEIINDSNETDNSISENQNKLSKKPS